MKTIALLFASICFTFAVFFTGCSDDASPTNITTSASTDSLMYSFDSLVVYSDNPIQTNAYYLYVEACTITKFRIQCNFTTNDTTTRLDTSYSLATTVLSNNNDTTNGAFVITKIGNEINFMLNQVVTLNVTTPYRLVGDVYLSFVRFSQNLHKYIRAKNFKLYKTS